MSIEEPKVVTPDKEVVASAGDIVSEGDSILSADQYDKIEAENKRALLLEELEKLNREAKNIIDRIGEIDGENVSEENERNEFIKKVYRKFEMDLTNHVRIEDMDGVFYDYFDEDLIRERLIIKEEFGTRAFFDEMLIAERGRFDNDFDIEIFHDNLYKAFKKLSVESGVLTA